MSMNGNGQSLFSRLGDLKFRKVHGERPGTPKTYRRDGEDVVVYYADGKPWKRSYGPKAKQIDKMITDYKLELVGSTTAKRVQSVPTKRTGERPTCEQFVQGQI